MSKCFAREVFEELGCEEKSVKIFFGRLYRDFKEKGVSYGHKKIGLNRLWYDSQKILKALLAFETSDSVGDKLNAIGAEGESFKNCRTLKKAIEVARQNLIT